MSKATWLLEVASGILLNRYKMYHAEFDDFVNELKSHVELIVQPDREQPDFILGFIKGGKELLFRYDKDSDEIFMDETPRNTIARMKE